jgi:hypothetical protein
MTKHIYTTKLPQYLTLDALKLLKNIIDNDTVSSKNKEEYEKLENHLQKFWKLSVGEYIDTYDTMIKNRGRECVISYTGYKILDLCTMDEFINMNFCRYNFNKLCDAIPSFITRLRESYNGIELNKIEYHSIVNVHIFKSYTNDMDIKEYIYNLIEEYEEFGYFDSFYNKRELDFTPHGKYIDSITMGWEDTRRTISARVMERWNHVNWYGLEHEKKSSDIWKMKALRALLLLPRYRKKHYYGV